MSGIVGIYNVDGKPVDPLLLEKMGARLAHRGLDGNFRLIRGAVGMFCQLNRITPESENEIQPLTDSSGAMLVFDGRLDNREELLTILQDVRQVSRNSSDPDLILATYRAFGEHMPEKLNGDFAFALFDPLKKKLLMARDSLGVRPLHYARIGNSFLFASEIKALLVHPALQARPNDDLLADFFLGQVYNQEITFFKNVFNVLPAHLLIISRDGLTKHRYWDFNPAGRVRFSAFNDYVDAFREIFERAVQNRLRSRHPVSVSLSGGLDSSSIYCLSQTLANRNRSRLPKIMGSSYTSMEGTPSNETAFLSDIEKTYATSIDRFPIGPTGFLEGAENATYHMEMPMLDEQWGNMRRFFSRVQLQGARVMLSGHWADQFLFDQAYLIDLFRGLNWKLAASHLRAYNRWMTDTDPKWFRERFVLDLIKHLTPSALFPIARKLRFPRQHPWFSRALHGLAFRRQWGRARIGLQFRSAHARSLYEQARTGYHVLCMEWQNKIGAAYGLEMAFPFLDRDLLSFLMAIPGEMQTHLGVPKALLRESMRDALPESIANRRWKADFTYLANEAVKEDLGSVVKLISNGKTEEWGYLNKEQLKNRLEMLKQGLSGPSAEFAWDVSEIASLAIWLETFCENGHGSHNGSIRQQLMDPIAEAKA